MTELRVYYEDTDAGGVVYYGKYLRYLEQGRTEFLRERGLGVREFQEKGYRIPVIRLEIDYRFPAVLDERLRVDTGVSEVAGATFTLAQRVVRLADEKTLAEAKVTLACLGPGNRARRLPPELLRALGRA